MIVGFGVICIGVDLKFGVIFDGEVELLCCVFYVGVGCGGIVILKVEVEVLFDLNDVIIEVENVLVWLELFFKVVVNYLMVLFGFMLLLCEVVLVCEDWLD